MTQTTTRVELPVDPTASQVIPRRPFLSRLSLGHLIMIVSGLLAFLLVMVVLSDRGATRSVAVAAIDIEAGSSLAPHHIRFAEVSETDAVIVDAFLDAGTIDAIMEESWVATRSIPAGTPVRQADLRPAATATGLRAMSLPIDVRHAVNGSVVAGDRVDIIVVRDGQATYLATSVEVIAVSSSSGGVGRGDFAITVSTDAETSLAIAAALETGGVEIVRATGAAPADPTAVFDLDALFSSRQSGP